MKPKTYTPVLLLALTLSSSPLFAAPQKGKSPTPAVSLTDAGKALEAKYSSIQGALKTEIQAALPKRDEAKVATWLQAIKAEEAAAKEAATKAKEVAKMKSAMENLTKLEANAKRAPKTFAEAKEEMEEILAKGESDEELAKLLESEDAFRAHIENEQKQLGKLIQKAKTTATAAQTALPEAIKAAEAAQQANEKAMAATWQAMDALGMNGILGSDALDGKLAQYTIINHATPRGLAEFAEKSPENEKLIQELFSNKDLMIQMLVADGPNSGKYGNAMKIYTDIQKASTKAKDGVFQRLALAVSLGHAVPIGERGATETDDAESSDDSDADSAKVIDPVKRYLSYEKWYLAGELQPGFKDLSVWNLAMTVDGTDSDEIMAWGRQMLNNLRPDCIPHDGDTSVYVHVVDKEIAYTSKMVKDDLPELAFMQNVLANGGICGRRAFFGRFTLSSYGVPNTARKQPGHATLAHWHPDGWQTKLGGNWGLGARGNYSSMNRARSSPYGADVNFLVSSQAREDETAFMKVKRAQWIGTLVGENPKPGLITISGKTKSNAKKKVTEVEKPIFWNELALQVQRRIVASLNPDISRSRSPKSVAANAPVATGKITVDDKGAITIPSAACSNPTQSTTSATKAGVKDLIVFVKNKAGETALHLSRYSSEADSFDYTFDAPKAGNYKLTVDVVTPMPNHSLFASANGGANIEIKLPYTIGLWGKTAPVQIELKQGKNVLKFHGPARVTLGDFILTPAP